MKVVGIIGGMGPAATADFFTRLIRATDAKRDQDHLHVIIDNDPSVPDRNRALAGTGPSSGPAMAAMARRLALAGADFLVIACNTAHAFIEAVRDASPLPVLDMIGLTVEKIISACDARRVGLLAVDGCLGAGLYQQRLTSHGLEPVVLEAKAQRVFMDLIYAIKANDSAFDFTEEMAHFAHLLASSGAEIIVAGCTEVPLVLDQARSPRPLISSVDILVEATIAFARGDSSILQVPIRHVNHGL